MFITAYSKERRNNNSTPCGNDLEPTYGYEVDKKGLKVLKENGKKDVFSEIQTHLEDTKIENVIQRVIAGDESILRPNAIYGDISEHPKNMIEAMNMIHSLENTYSQLSDDAKKLYPTIESFVENAGTENWMRVNGYIKNNTTPIVNEKLLTTETTIANAIDKEVPNES